MEWLLFTWIAVIAIVTLIAGLIFYRKNKELNQKIKKLKEQTRIREKWLS